MNWFDPESGGVRARAIVVIVVIVALTLITLVPLATDYVRTARLSDNCARIGGYYDPADQRCKAVK